MTKWHSVCSYANVPMLFLKQLSCLPRSNMYCDERLLLLNSWTQLFNWISNRYRDSILFTFTQCILWPANCFIYINLIFIRIIRTRTLWFKTRQSSKCTQLPSFDKGFHAKRSWKYILFCDSYFKSDYISYFCTSVSEILTLKHNHAYKTNVL